MEVVQAVLKTGFRGWFSHEVFDGGSDGKGINADMLSYAETAANCQKKLLIKCAQARGMCLQILCHVTSRKCILSCNHKICIVLIYSSFIHKRYLIPSTKPLSTLCGPSSLSILPLATGQSSLRL